MNLCVRVDDTVITMELSMDNEYFTAKPTNLLGDCVLIKKTKGVEDKHMYTLWPKLLDGYPQIET